VCELRPLELFRGHFLRHGGLFSSHGGLCGQHLGIAGAALLYVLFPPTHAGTQFSRVPKRAQIAPCRARSLESRVWNGRKMVCSRARKRHLTLHCVFRFLCLPDPDADAHPLRAAASRSQAARTSASRSGGCWKQMRESGAPSASRSGGCGKQMRESGAPVRQGYTHRERAVLWGTSLLFASPPTEGE
jgi:hypothetical protein